MRSNRILTSVPVFLQGFQGANRLHWWRRALQIGTLVAVIMIPLAGLFRIDPIAGAFVVLDRQIWWSDFFIVFGFWLMAASSLVLLYSAVGTAFCGWSCPQNTLSEWANWLTRKLLGKRAAIQLHGEKITVGASKDRWLNWTVLGLSLVIISLFVAFIPLLYFYPPQVIWSFITFQPDDRLAGSLHYIYLIFVILVLLDIAFIRHFWCRFMCVYKVWQHGFKTNNTLHIHYDESNSDLCEKCNYCVTACFIDIDPRQANTYDTCINCGECITACNTLQAKSERKGLLSYRIGEKVVNSATLVFYRLSALSTRVKWTIPIIVLGLTMFVSGLARYEPYHLSVYRADILHGAQIRDYRISVSNKRYTNTLVTLKVDGLNNQQYTLSRPKALFKTVGRIDIQMHIDAELPPGLHSFIVHAQSTDGWKDSYRVQHFVAKG